MERKQQPRAQYDVAVVGAGFSGTMTAVNLTRKSAGRLRIALIERSKAHGRGLAYGTTDSQHLLNVPAGQMGAFPGDVSGFWRWTEQNPHRLRAAGVSTAKPTSYLPRLVYGEYLQQTLRDAMRETGCIDTICDDAVGLAANGSSGFEISCASGETVRAAVAVLAVGNFPPALATGGEARCENPYSPDVWRRLAAPGDVLIVGTGLTSLDLVMTLARRKEQGAIHLLSRRGLFPQVHRPAAQYEPFLDLDNLPTTARALSRVVRRRIRAAEEQEGADWRSVVDSLRPASQRIWEALGEREQRRFLRRLRVYWDIHRHRCAPEIAAVRDTLERQGRLVVHKGRVISIDDDDAGDGLSVRWRPSGSRETQCLRVRHAVSCTGPQTDIRRVDDPLIKDMLARNLVSADPLQMGIATNLDYTAVGERRGLYTLGSPLKGRLYESVAVPELRVQADEVARNIVAFLGTPGKPPAAPENRSDGLGGLYRFGEPGRADIAAASCFTRA